MNIKIKASGVYCLIGDDYDKVYAALKKQLGEGDEQIFTERTPGHEYLQWELPGEGWTALSDSDPLMSQEVRTELLRRMQAVSARFGANQQMAQKVLSYPDDAYVYYKADADGRIVVKLTAWGYRYPERIGDGASTGVLTPAEKTEHVVIKLQYDGKPMPAKSLKLNGFLRTADVNGILEVGRLPIGYQFDIDVDEHHQHVVVMPGEGEIVVDMTAYVPVEVRVRKDGAPSGGATVQVQYSGRTLQLTCDSNGCCMVKLPLDPANAPCLVTVENETQQQVLGPSLTLFEFDIQSKTQGTSADNLLSGFEPPRLEELHPPLEEPLQKQQKQVEVRVYKNGMPCRGILVKLHCLGREQVLYADDNGLVRTTYETVGDDALCTVEVKGTEQQQVLAEPLTVFDFDITQTDAAPEQATIEVHVLMGDKPYPQAPVVLSYKGQESKMYCDDAGQLSVNLLYEESDEPCFVSVDDLYQSRPLRRGINRFDFYCKERPGEEPEEPSWKSYLKTGLLGLLIAALVAGTYWIGYHLLF